MFWLQLKLCYCIVVHTICTIRQTPSKKDFSYMLSWSKRGFGWRRNEKNNKEPDEKQSSPGPWLCLGSDLNQTLDNRWGVCTVPGVSGQHVLQLGVTFPNRDPPWESRSSSPPVRGVVLLWSFVPVGVWGGGNRRYVSVVPGHIPVAWLTRDFCQKSPAGESTS